MVSNGIKTKQEQALALNLFADKIKILDETHFSFLQTQYFKELNIKSLNDLIVLKTESFEEFVLTEMQFLTDDNIPWNIKHDLIAAFSDLFRD